jgi:hypothetical protein
MVCVHQHAGILIDVYVNVNYVRFLFFSLDQQHPGFFFVDAKLIEIGL